MNFTIQNTINNIINQGKFAIIETREDIIQGNILEDRGEDITVMMISPNKSGIKRFIYGDTEASILTVCKSKILDIHSTEFEV